MAHKGRVLPGRSVWAAFSGAIGLEDQGERAVQRVSSASCVHGVGMWCSASVFLIADVNREPLRTCASLHACTAYTLALLCCLAISCLPLAFSVISYPPTHPRWTSSPSYPPCLCGCTDMDRPSTRNRIIVFWNELHTPKRANSKISDVLLDAEDNNLASRGTILDTEGQALLLRLRDLRPPSAIASGSAVAGATATATSAGTAAAAVSQQRSSGTVMNRENSSSGKDGGNRGVGLGAAAVAEGVDDGGWQPIESSLRRAISLRYVHRGGGRAGGRARYVEQLSDALRGLEQARYVCVCVCIQGGGVDFGGIFRAQHEKGSDFTTFPPQLFFG